MRRRLDVYLTQRGDFPSREKAQAAIMAGQVWVDGAPATKAGALLREGATVEVKARSPYVGRGGHKLERALDVFGVDPAGRVVLDAGAATGGFTHCLLLRGARRVYAVDVGYGQLDFRLRQDPRVRVLERRDLRSVRREELEELPTLITLDLAFISLARVLPTVGTLLAGGGEVVALVKPQFEAGREQVGRRGVVRDPAVHRQVLERVAAAAGQAGFRVRAMTHSPLKGPEGNIEFFMHLEPGAGPPPTSEAVRRTVEIAWAELCP
ncbi:MAG: TlyA family RNA methyltransferase [Thermaerobacter sp.]|nr:TlyA family RNA methyltransferase [Thermaerobacter sp.]